MRVQHAWASWVRMQSWLEANHAVDNAHTGVILHPGIAQDLLRVVASGTGAGAGVGEDDDDDVFEGMEDDEEEVGWLAGWLAYFLFYHCSCHTKHLARSVSHLTLKWTEWRAVHRFRGIHGGHGGHRC